MRGVCPSRRRETCQTAPPPAPFPHSGGSKATRLVSMQTRGGKKSVTDKSDILQIVKFVVALLITAFKFPLLSQSPDPIAVKSRCDQQSCSFKRAPLIRFMPECSKGPLYISIHFLFILKGQISVLVSSSSASSTTFNTVMPISDVCCNFIH